MMAIAWVGLSAPDVAPTPLDTAVGDDPAKGFAGNFLESEGTRIAHARPYPDATYVFTPGFACVEAAFERFQGLLDDLIDAPLRASGLAFATADVTRTFVAAIRGFPEIATDVAELRRMIEIQCSLLLAAIRRD